MTDDVFRPERRPISRAEIQNVNVPEQQSEPTPPPAPIPQVSDYNQMENTRRVVNKELGNQAFQTDSPPLKVSGRAPQEFLQRMQGVINDDNETTAPPPMRTTGRPQVEEIINIIRGVTREFDRIQLPSLGRFYDGTDGPKDGVLHIRPMTGEEEAILATPRWAKKGSVAIDMIFNRCLKEKYKSESFLSVDRTFLLIWLRAISYSHEYEVEITCPFTDRKFQEIIDLNLEVDLCPDDFGPDQLVGTLPATGLSFRYHLAKGSDDQRIIDYREQKSKFDPNPNKADDTLLYKTALMIDELQGLTDKFEIQQVLTQLPVGDINHLRNLTNEPPFGVRTKVEVYSPYGLQNFEIELPLETNFFFPKRRKI